MAIPLHVSRRSALMLVPHVLCMAAHMMLYIGATADSTILATRGLPPDALLFVGSALALADPSYVAELAYSRHNCSVHVTSSVVCMVTEDPANAGHFQRFADEDARKCVLISEAVQCLCGAGSSGALTWTDAVGSTESVPQPAGMCDEWDAIRGVAQRIYALSMAMFIVLLFGTGYTVMLGIIMSNSAFEKEWKVHGACALLLCLSACVLVSFGAWILALHPGRISLPPRFEFVPTDGANHALLLAAATLGVEIADYLILRCIRARAGLDKSPTERTAATVAPAPAAV